MVLLATLRLADPFSHPFSSLFITNSFLVFPSVSSFDRKVKDKIGAKIAGTTSAVSSGSCLRTLFRALV